MDQGHHKWNLHCIMLHNQAWIFKEKSAMLYVPAASALRPNYRQSIKRKVKHSVGFEPTISRPRSANATQPLSLVYSLKIRLPCWQRWSRWTSRAGRSSRPSRWPPSMTSSGCCSRTRRTKTPAPAWCGWSCTGPGSRRKLIYLSG